MSSDLEHRLAAAAIAWEREAPAIALAEITGHPRSEMPDLTEAIEVEIRPSPPDRRRTLAIAAALLVVLGVTAVLARRSPDAVDPVSPAITTQVQQTTTEAAVTPTSAAPPTTSDGADAAAPTSTVPVALPADEVAARISAIDAERHTALRGFTTIGFTFERTTTLADGSPWDGGDASSSSARVVLRNDGSAAVRSDSFGRSYYDAVTGTAVVVQTGPDGKDAYYQLDGQMDGSLGLGIPTGLVTGFVTSIGSLTYDVVAIEEDTVGGRATWRIDQRRGASSPSLLDVMEASTWIDRATGITLQTRSVGESFADVGEKRTPLTETVTLRELVVDEPMPADFPPVAPPGVEVDRSGDPTEFGPITIEAAAAELGPGAVVPTVPADQVSMYRYQVENAAGGNAEVVPTLIVRWFDGFSATELWVARTPSFMQPTASCADCSTTLLGQLQGSPLAVGGVNVWVGRIQVSIVGDPERIRAIVDSLVTTS